MAGVNKVIIAVEINHEDEFELYLSGKSIPDIHKITGIPLSTLRHRFLKAGILRERTQAIGLARTQEGKFPSKKGCKRSFSQQHRENISRSKQKAGRNQASGIDIHNGYARFTRGENKGKLVHVFIMENRIGRKLKADECVHHIDGDRLNNDINNLALLTISGHGRLHRLQDQIAGIERERDDFGRYS